MLLPSNLERSRGGRIKRIPGRKEDPTQEDVEADSEHQNNKLLQAVTQRKPSLHSTTSSSNDNSCHQRSRNDIFAVLKEELPKTDKTDVVKRKKKSKTRTREITHDIEDDYKEGGVDKGKKLKRAESKEILEIKSRRELLPEEKDFLSPPVKPVAVRHVKSSGSQVSRARSTTSTSYSTFSPANQSILGDVDQYRQFVYLVDQSMQTQKYYHGYVNAEYFLKILAKPGDFMVCILSCRQKGEQGGGMIETSGVAVRHSNGGCKFIEIRGKRNKSFHFGGSIRRASMHELVMTYIKMGEPMPKYPHIKLLNPVCTPMCIISHERVKLMDEIGRGQFGKVFRANFLGEENLAAAKTFRTDAIRKDPSARDKFLEEAYVMSRLKHENIVRSYGMCTLQPPLIVVMELCTNGSAKAYLRKNAGLVPLSTQVRFSTEASAGLRYLEFEKLVHRDVAARNCMLNAKMTLKIGDFGLTMDAEKLEKNKPKSLTLPIKWISPEVFREQKFSHKSDVWAFGVTLYEFFTDADEPYPGINNKVVRKKITEDDAFRMRLPTTIPGTARDLISACWHPIPDQRPSFKQLHKSFYNWGKSL